MHSELELELNAHLLSRYTTDRVLLTGKDKPMQ